MPVQVRMEVNSRRRRNIFQLKVEEVYTKRKISFLEKLPKCQCPNVGCVILLGASLKSSVYSQTRLR